MTKATVKKANQFCLNRQQVEKLAKMAAHFKEVEWFTLEESSSSGIGPTVVVKFNLFNDDDKDIDTTVDITDVSTW
jgi:heptaprenylglyceryl phosphate synthase